MAPNPSRPLSAALRRVVQAAAREFKGPAYTLDDRLDFTALANLARDRLFGLLRCVLRGVTWSHDIRALIFVGPDVTLRNKKYINFGRGVTLGKGVQIDGLSTEGVHIGDRVVLGPYTIIEATGVITELGRGCRIGADSGIGAFSFIGAAGGVWIGKKVIMGQRVSFHSEKHNFQRLDIPIKDQGVTRKGIVVEDDCWIGAGVIFLDGTRVGRGSVIGAGSVVRGDIPPFSIAAGVPARIIRTRTGQKMTNGA